MLFVGGGGVLRLFEGRENGRREFPSSFIIKKINKINVEMDFVANIRTERRFHIDASRATTG